MAKGETLGFAMATVFVALAAVRDVHFGAVLQQHSPLTVAVTAFALCTAVFVPLALVRDPAGLAALVRRPRGLFWINLTSALPWLAFFQALAITEPALAQVIFFGIGPLSVTWVDRLVTGRAVPPPGAVERRLRAGLLAALLVSAGVLATGVSGVGRQPWLHVVAALALTIGGGLLISINTVLCRAVNDAGIGPTALLALRFPGAVVLALALAAVRGDVATVAAPGVLLAIAPMAFLLVVLPIYVNQIAIALASPVTVRVVLAAGPTVVFALQALEGRLPSSPFTLAACVLYGALAVAGAAARRRGIAGADRPLVATAAGR